MWHGFYVRYPYCLYVVRVCHIDLIVCLCGCTSATQNMCPIEKTIVITDECCGSAMWSGCETLQHNSCT